MCDGVRVLIPVCPRVSLIDGLTFMSLFDIVATFLYSYIFTPTNTAVSNLVSKLGQIGPKWDVSGTF